MNAPSRCRRRRAGQSGGVDGNERLTAATAVVLVVLLAALGITILVHRAAHLVARAARDAPDPTRPPQARQYRLALRPLLRPARGTTCAAGRRSWGCDCWRRSSIVSTLAVFATGVALLVIGPAGGVLVGLHKASFVVWLVVTAMHVLAHLRRIPGLVAADWRRRPASARSASVPGTAWRRLLLAGSDRRGRRRSRSQPFATPIRGCTGSARTRCTATVSPERQLLEDRERVVERADDGAAARLDAAADEEVRSRSRRAARRAGP